MAASLSGLRTAYPFPARKGEALSARARAFFRAPRYGGAKLRGESITRAQFARASAILASRAIGS
jgi:hypothetical protein